jgi:hypothetical protein
VAETHKRKPKALTRSQIAEAREHLNSPLHSPRPWLDNTPRDPRLASALQRKIDQTILTAQPDPPKRTP